MLLESETDLKLALGLAAFVFLALACLGFFLWFRAAAGLREANAALSKTEIGADRTERRMFSILQAIPIALVETDTAGKFIFANRAAHQLLGRKDAELIGLRFHSATWGITYPDGRLIPPDLLPAARALRGQTVKGFQHLMVNPNSRKQMLVSVTAMPILNDAGEVIGSSSAIVETETLSTPQPEPEDEVYSRFVDIAGVLLLALGRDGRVRDINPYGAELLGLSMGEAIGRDWIGNFLPEEDREDARAFFTDVVEDRREMPAEGEGWIVRRDGERRLICWRGVVLRDARGRVASTLSSGEDITERRAAETRAMEAAEAQMKAEAARASAEAQAEEATQAAALSAAEVEQAKAAAEALAATAEAPAAAAPAAETPQIADAAPVLIWITDGAGGCTWVNQAWRDYTGRSLEQDLGDGWTGALHPDDVRRNFEAYRGAVERRAPYRLEYRVRGRDGQWRWIEASGAPRRDASGEFEGYIGAGADITPVVEARELLEQRLEESRRQLEAATEERRETQKALVRAQKLEAVGRLAGGVAQDFNSLVAVVIGALEMIVRQSGNPERVERLGEAALAASRRGERLTQQLLAFSQRDETRIERLNLGPVIRGLEPMLRRTGGEHVAVTVQAEDVGEVEIDAVQLETTLHNLVLNARDASAPGGAIRVTAERETLAEDQIDGLPAGDYARIVVADAGSGMTPDVAARAFEAYFTTKSAGEGTGLGLAQVMNFAKQSGGAAWITSQPGEGAAVTLHLPLAPERDPAAA